MSECKNGSCSTHSKHHSSCGCGSSSGCQSGCSCSGCSGKCGCGCHANKGCSEGDFAHTLLEMADEAWMCLLKDKIKAKINGLSGAKLDELADLVANSNHKRWISKMAAHEAKDDFEDNVASFFSHQK